MASSLTENPIFAEILRRYVQRAEQVISREVSAQGLVLTGEMLNSIKAAAVEKGTGWIRANVSYEALLRIKDLKTLNYSRMPPLSAMIKFVEQVGVQNLSTQPATVRRIARKRFKSSISRAASSVSRGAFAMSSDMSRTLIAATGGCTMIR